MADRMRLAITAILLTLVRPSSSPATGSDSACMLAPGGDADCSMLLPLDQTAPERPPSAHLPSRRTLLKVPAIPACPCMFEPTTFCQCLHALCRRLKHYRAVARAASSNFRIAVLGVAMQLPWLGFTRVEPPRSAQHRGRQASGASEQPKCETAVVVGGSGAELAHDQRWKPAGHGRHASGTGTATESKNQ